MLIMRSLVGENKKNICVSEVHPCDAENFTECILESIFRLAVFASLQNHYNF